MSRVTPTGETVNVASHEQWPDAPNLFKAAAPIFILQDLYLYGPVEDKSGRATSTLAERIIVNWGKKFAPKTLSSAITTLVGLDVLKRQIKGKRTYKITIDDGRLPVAWFDRIVANVEALVPPEPVVEPEPEQIAEEPQASDVLERPATIPPAVVEALEIIINNIVAQETTITGLQELMANLVNENQKFHDDNQKLQSQLNAASVQMRQIDSILHGENHNPKPKPQALDFRALNVKNVRLRKVLKHAAEHGFTIKRTNGDHIQCIPPQVGRDIVTGSCTPSDHRAIQNFHHQLVRSGMPKLENF